MTEMEFRAYCQDSGFLAELETSIAAIGDRPKERLRLNRFLMSKCYFPEPGTADTFRDLRYDDSLNLLLDFNVCLKQSRDWFVKGQDEDVLPAFPACEMVKVCGGKCHRNWKTIWRESGGRLYSNRMIALKDDPVWTKISRFGLPHPPFDWRMETDVVDIDKIEAEQLGLPRRMPVPQRYEIRKDLLAPLILAIRDTVGWNDLTTP